VPPSLECQDQGEERANTTQEARTFKLKLDRSKISRKGFELLLRLFLEAKWFTNYFIANGIANLESHRDYKLKTVPVKVVDTFEDREISVLSSQMRQALIKP
jgi:hypothetical protein